MAQESSDVKCTTATTNSKGTHNNNSEEAAAADGGDRPLVVVSSSSAPATPFKFNVHAPEFVPMSPNAASPMASPMSAPAGGYYSPFMQMQADWSFFHDHEPVFFMPDHFASAKFGAAAAAGSNSGAQAKGTGATADVTHKIVKQVENQFSDINLVANEFLLKIMNKDTEGYGTVICVSVPINN